MWLLNIEVSMNYWRNYSSLFIVLWLPFHFSSFKAMNHAENLSWFSEEDTTRKNNPFLKRQVELFMCEFKLKVFA